MTAMQRETQLATAGLEGRIREEEAGKAILSTSPGKESDRVLEHLGWRFPSDSDSKAVHLNCPKL